MFYIYCYSNKDIIDKLNKEYNNESFNKDKYVQISSSFMIHTKLAVIDVSKKNANNVLKSIKKSSEQKFMPIVFINVPTDQALFYYEKYTFSTVFTKDANSNDIIKKIKGFTVELIKLKDRNEKFVRLTTNKKEICVLQSDIIYIESGRNRTIVHTFENSFSCKYIKISDCKKIFGDDFIICHRSFAVNRFYISNINMSDRIIYLCDGNYSVNMGRVFKQDFLTEIGLM